MTLYRKQEASGWELRAGFLGTVRVTVPLTALYTEPCSIEVHEALFTMRPRPRGAARRQTTDAADGAPGSGASRLGPSEDARACAGRQERGTQNMHAWRIRCRCDAAHVA